VKRRSSPLRPEEPAELQVSIFLRSGDRYAGKPLVHEAVMLAKAAGLRGATVIRGLQGFGASGRLDGAGRLGFSGSEPVIIELCDEPDRMAAFLARAEPLLRNVLVVTKPVVATRWVAAAPEVMATEGR